MNDALLDGLLVLDLSQFLSGPCAALRLGDLGARIVKVERPDGGDLCRRLYLTDTEIGGDPRCSTRSTATSRAWRPTSKAPADLAAEEADRARGRADPELPARRDRAHRPGLRRLPGDQPPASSMPASPATAAPGPGSGGPGQDLLAQSRSGLTWLSGSDGDGPVPFGLAIADMLAGGAVVQGILAALIRRGRTKRVCMSTSLLEVLVGRPVRGADHLPQRWQAPADPLLDHNAHAYLKAPYGIYRASDGWIARSR